MGWTYLHREPGMTDRDFFQGEFKSIEILEAGTRENVCYLACRQSASPGEVFAVICLIDRFGDRRDPYYNFGYKDQDETMGPGDADCPRKVFDLLTPLEEMELSESGREWAGQWREHAAEALARREAASRVKAGDIVEFPAPLRFSDGSSSSRFRFVERDTFQPVREGETVSPDVPLRRWGLVRIRGWRTLDFSHQPVR